MNKYPIEHISEDGLTKYSYYNQWGHCTFYELKDGVWEWVWNSNGYVKVNRNGKTEVIGEANKPRAMNWIGSILEND